MKAEEGKKNTVPPRYGTVGEENKTPANLGLAVGKPALPPERPPARGGDCVDADKAEVVRRSSVAPGVTCGLCGGILRDATTVSECLHSCELPLMRFLMREMGMLSHLLVCGILLGDGQLVGDLVVLIRT